MRILTGCVLTLLLVTCKDEQPVNCDGPITLIPSSPSYCKDADAAARCLMNKGDYGVSAAIFSGLLKTCGESVDALLNLTNCLHNLERWDEASAMAHKAFDRDSTNSNVRYNLAITERSIGDYESAMRIIRNTPSAKTDRDFQFLAFQLAWELGDSTACYDHIRRAIQIAPDDKILRLRHAARLMSDQRTEEAEAIAFGLYRDEPDTTEFHFELVEWVIMYYLQIGDTAKACLHTIELARSPSYSERVDDYAMHCP